MYPALLPLRTTRLPVVDSTDATADLNGLVHSAERRNLVSARVPSYFKRSLLYSVLHVDSNLRATAEKIERFNNLKYFVFIDWLCRNLHAILLFSSFPNYEDCFHHNC